MSGFISYYGGAPDLCLPPSTFVAIRAFPRIVRVSPVRSSFMRIWNGDSTASGEGSLQTKTKERGD